MSAPQPVDLLARVAHLEAEVHHYRTLFLRERAEVARLTEEAEQRDTPEYLTRIERQLAQYKELFRKASEDLRRLNAANASLRAKLREARKVPGERGVTT